MTSKSVSEPSNDLADRRCPRDLAIPQKMLVVRRVDFRPDLVLLAVAGELDAWTVRLLERHLFADPPRGMIVDLGGVEFLSVAGIRVLLRAAERARSERRRFGVVASTRAVTRVLRLTEADAEMAVSATLSDAVRELPSSPPRQPGHAGLRLVR